jgi:hypothetical protein
MQSTILGGVVASLVLFAAPTVGALGPHAGGIDTNEACHMQHGDATRAEARGQGAFDWYCTDGVHSYNIDWNQYCEDKYGNGAQADPLGGGLYDWSCNYPR